MASICLTFKENAKEYSKISVLFYIPTNNIGAFQMLLTLTDTNTDTIDIE